MRCIKNSANEYQCNYFSKATLFNYQIVIPMNLSYPGTHCVIYSTYSKGMTIFEGTLWRCLISLEELNELIESPIELPLSHYLKLHTPRSPENMTHVDIDHGHLLECIQQLKLLALIGE